MAETETIQLIYGRRRPNTFKLEGFEVLSVDVTINETLTYENDVTDFPVESGASVTDHIRNLPDRYTMTGLITNTPLTLPESVQNSNENFQEQKGINVGDNRASTRSQYAYEAIVGLYRSRIPFDIVTQLTLYENMTFTSLSIPRDAQTVESFRFTADFRQVVFAETEFETVPNANDSINAGSTDRASGVTNAGTQEKKPATEETEQSILSRASELGLNGIKGLFGR